MYHLFGVHDDRLESRIPALDDLEWASDKEQKDGVYRDNVT